MPVEDVFSITGRGTVATGRIETGVIHVGDEIEILGLGEDKKSVVTGVEMFRKLLDQGEAGDNVGLLLRGIDKNEIKRGMVLCKPGQIKPHSKFNCLLYTSWYLCYQFRLAPFIVNGSILTAKYKLFCWWIT